MGEYLQVQKCFIMILTISNFFSQWKTPNQPNVTNLTTLELTTKVY